MTAAAGSYEVTAAAGFYTNMLQLQAVFCYATAAGSYLVAASAGFYSVTATAGFYYVTAAARF